jgi:EAL domain-containing protein (putative c-di-GMP-specific phosphodiesterase class I)
MERTGLEEAIRRAADPVVLMQRVADEAMTLVSGVDGVLVGFVHDPTSLTFECGAGCLAPRIGERVPLEGSLAGLAIQSGETRHCDDAGFDPRAERDFCQASGIRSFVCVPLWRGNRSVGALCVGSCRVHAFDGHDAATLTSLAEFISAVIMVAIDLAGVTDALLSRAERDTPGATAACTDDRAAEARFVANVLNPGAIGRLESRSRVDRCLSGRGLTHAFQPVFDITGGDCFAVEALARFSAQPKRTPDVWFAEAHEMGVGVELEIVSVKRALSCLPRLSPDVALCLNAGPGAIVSDELLHLLEASQPRRIIMELTEETRVDDYSRLSGALGLLRSMGVRLAIDDTGAGFASLAHILKLAPDLIKLDRELTSGIDRDPVRKALATALVSFASGLGAQIIAEGIETVEELDVLRGLGIRYGQGFYLCRPTSTDAIPACLSPKTLSGTVSRAS